jgi:hypothetical protein
MKVYARTCGEPMYLGRFRVDRNTIRGYYTGKTWAETIRGLGTRIPIISHVRMIPMYRVYEARNHDETGAYQVAVSAVREISLREEIASGERRMALLRMVLETDDRNEARAAAGGMEI